MLNHAASFHSHSIDDLIGAGRILFVDDESSLVNLGNRMLRLLGYEPVGVTCPRAALDLFRSQTFDGVVTDLTMPGMSGIELGRELRAICPQIPILLTTAYHHVLEDRDAATLGFNGLLLKPYDVRALGGAVQQMLGQQFAWM